MAKCMHSAGTSQLASDGRNKLKNPVNETMPFCHTIKVVMSPKGLKAPPALAATTILMQAGTRNLGLPRPTLNMTAPITSAVVRLSRMGDSTKADSPVSQNMLGNEKRLATIQDRKAAKTFRSSSTLT